MRPYPWKLCRSPLSAPVLKPIGNGLVAAEGNGGLTIPASLRQLLFHDDGTATEHPAYYTEEEWPGHSHLLKDYSLGVGSLRPKRPGYCYDFDGVDDFVGVSNNAGEFDVTDELSICMNLYVDSFGSVNSALIGNYTSVGPSGWMIFMLTSGVLRFYAANGNALFALMGAITSGNWLNLVMIKSGLDCTFYINGIDQSAADFSNAVIGPGNSQLQIARYNTAYSDVKMSNLMVFDKALSIAEAEWYFSDFRSGTDPGDTNLLLHLPMQEESGNISFDIGPNGYHGDIFNSQAGFHAVDAGVAKSYPNDDGHSDAYVGAGTSKDTFLILTGAQCVGKTGSTIKFKIKTSDTQGAIFGANQDGVAALGFIQNTNAATWYFAAGTPTATVDGVAIGNNRADLYNAVVDGEVHEVVMSNVNLDATFDSHGLYFAGYRNAAWYFTGLVWDLEIDGVKYSAPVKPAINSATAADGSELIYSGRNPNYGLVKSPSWQGDGLSVYIDLGLGWNVACPTTSPWELELPVYITNATGTRVIVGSTNASANHLRTLTNGTLLTFSYGGTTQGFNSDTFTHGLPLNSWYKINLIWNGANQLTWKVDGRVVRTTTITNPNPNLGAIRLLMTNTGSHSDYRIGYFRSTVGGVATTYWPLEGNRNLAYLASNGTGGILIDAVKNGTLANLYSDGDGSWRNPNIEHGGRFAVDTEGAVYPGRAGTDLAANGLALTIARNKAPMTVEVDRAGGVIAPWDYQHNIDSYASEAFDDAVADSNVNKRLANAQYSDRYGAAESDISAAAYFGSEP